MSAKVTLQFCVPAGYQPGDYAQLFGNSGAGDIDYDTPLLRGRKIDLFPMGSGIYGCYESPCYESPCYMPFSTRTPGCYYEPCFYSPFGLGTALIEAEIIVETCGDYKFAFACFDSLDNPGEGDPQELLLTIHTAPPAPTGLVKNSYDKDTDVLILDVAV
jgi:hypothetical protein